MDTRLGQCLVDPLDNSRAGVAAFCIWYAAISMVYAAILVVQRGSLMVTYDDVIRTSITYRSLYGNRISRKRHH